MNRFILPAIAFILVFSGFYFFKTTSPTPSIAEDSRTKASEDKPQQKITVPENAYLYKISEGSSVSYVALKKFFEKPEQHVTGSTTEINGDGWFDPNENKGYVAAYLDFSTIATDNKKRDEDVLKLFTDRNVRFSADISAISASIGESFESDVPGQIIINGITRDVTFKVTGQVNESDLSAKGSAWVKMSDFGINPPSLINVFTADDNLELKFDIKADRLRY